MTTAQCGDCGKTYQVPDPSKTYKCKACGGRVAVVEEAEAAASPASPPPPPKAAAARTEPKSRRRSEPNEHEPSGDRPHRPRRGSKSRTGLIVGGVLVLAVLGVAAFVMQEKTPEDLAEDFREAWNEGDLETAFALYKQEGRAKMVSVIRNRLKRDGFDPDSPPELGEAEVEESKVYYFSATYELESGKLIVLWERNEGDDTPWYIDMVDLRQLGKK